MKKNYYVIITVNLFLLLTSFSFASSNYSWKSVRKNKVFESWHLEGVKDVYISKTVTKVKTKKIKKLLKSKKYIKSLNKNKSPFLELFGVNNWKMNYSKWKTKNLLEVSGTYVDKDSHLVSFYEFHQFKNNKIVKYLYVQPKNSNLKQTVFRKFINQQLKKK